MPKESHLELKVGTFVLVALVLLTIFLFSISDFAFFEKGKSLKIIFNFANGLRKYAPVRVAGVDQGFVEDIHVFFDPRDQKTKVMLRIRIKKDTKIPVDSEFIINQLGLLGEKYIEVIPGEGTKYFSGEEDVLEGKDPVAQEMISEKVMGVATKLEKSIDHFNEIVGDEENQSSLKLTLHHLSELTERLSVISDNIKEGKGTVGKLFYDESLYNNLEELTADLKANPWKLLYQPKSEKEKGKR